MKSGSTLFLRFAVFLIGTPVVVLCILGVLDIARKPIHPEDAYFMYPILIGFYVSVIPFFAALYQAFKLLSYIDRNQAFSDLSVQALKKIKLCAVAISVIYVIVWPFVFPVAQLEDAPGLVIFAAIPIFASMVIAVFAAVLQRLLKEAIDIKSENELTI